MLILLVKGQGFSVCSPKLFKNVQTLNLTMWENPNTFLRPRGQNQPTKVSNSDWTALENVNRAIGFGLLTAFSYI